VKISTARFGAVDVSSQNLLVLSQGLIGFPSLTRFAIIDAEHGSVFQWWQAADAPDIALVVMDPLLIVPDYDVGGLEAEWAELGADDPGVRQVVVIVTASGPSLSAVTLNLAAPVLVNRTARQGRQVVLPDARYDTAVRLDDVVAPKGPVELAA
jgi:flagellar assembly factor FliW